MLQFVSVYRKLPTLTRKTKRKRNEENNMKNEQQPTHMNPNGRPQVTDTDFRTFATKHGLSEQQPPAGTTGNQYDESHGSMHNHPANASYFLTRKPMASVADGEMTPNKKQFRNARMRALLAELHEALTETSRVTLKGIAETDSTTTYVEGNEVGYFELTAQHAGRVERAARALAALANQR